MTLQWENYLLALLSSSIQLLALLSTFSYLSQAIAASLLTTPADTSSTPNSLLTQAGFLNRRGRVIRGVLLAVSSLSWLWLYAEAYNIARPIYVCQYPIRGDYVHHPHETRMRIQWLCYFVAAVLAAVLAAGTVGYDLCFMRSTYKALVDRAGPGAMENSQSGEKKGEDGKEERTVSPHEGLSDRELVDLWKKLKIRRDLFMLYAGIVGTIGCLVITGKNRHRFFDGW
jgi:hypothetical protein